MCGINSEYIDQRNNAALCGYLDHESAPCNKMTVCKQFICHELPFTFLNAHTCLCGHTLPGHPQFQQNEFQPTCRSHSATHSMSRLMASGHTQLEVVQHGRLCASQAHHVLNFVVFASAFSGRSPRSHALIRRAVSHQTPMPTEPVSSTSQPPDQAPAANHTSSRTPSGVGIPPSPPPSPPSFLSALLSHSIPST